jgi:hypothetical protein
MKMPAAMASNPIIMPSPVKLKLNNAISPVKKSQIASKSMPMFFVNLLMNVSSLYGLGLVFRRYYRPSALVQTRANILSISHIQDNNFRCT